MKDITIELSEDVVSGFKNNFQLTHWKGCKYCKRK